MNTNSSIVLLDICGTLFNSNTTFDFLDFSMKSKRYYSFRLLSKTIPWRVLNKVCIKVLKRDLTRIIAVKFLKGLDTIVLNEMMDDFYKNRLSDLRNEKVLDLVEDFRNKGMNIIIISATLDFIAKKIAEELNIEVCHSTILNYRNNLCLGTIKRDLLSKKNEFLSSIGYKGKFYATITDNMTDLDIIKNSERAFIVSKDRHLKIWYGLLEKNQIEKYKIIAF